MTSDKADCSPSRELLDYALRKKRISLGKLNPEEFDELLQEILLEIDLRELRGFKPLKDFLSRSPGGFLVGGRQDPTETVRVNSGFLVNTDADLFTLSTHVVSVHRGCLSQKVIYRRYESGEETSDWKVANSWESPGGYVRNIQESFLVLRRPNDHSRAYSNLFEVACKIDKVHLKNEMEVVSIDVRSIHDFRFHFGHKYASVAQYMILELASLSRQTLDSLKYQVVNFEEKSRQLTQFSESIME